MPSHKSLKSVERSLAESFTSLMNYALNDYVMGHIVYAAWSTGVTEFCVDLLTGATNDSPLLTWPVRKSVAAYVDRVPELISASNSHSRFVATAEMIVTVDPNTRRPLQGGAFEASPFTCTVRIVDDRGKEYSHCIQDWWYPEKSPLPRRARDMACQGMCRPKGGASTI